MFILRQLIQLVPMGLLALCRQTRASVSIMFAVILPTLLILAGLVVDFNQAKRHDDRVTDALDAALLAAASALRDGLINDGEFDDYGDDVFAAQMGNLANLRILRLNFTPPDDSGRAAGEVVVRVNTTFLKLMDVDYLDVRAVSEVQVAASKVELALILDVSTSMKDDGKIDMAKKAATQLVNVLMPAANGKAKISLVPFAGSVNIGPYTDKLLIKKDINQIRRTGGSYCAGERWETDYKAQTSLFDDSPPGRFSGRFRRDPNGYCPAQPLMPLTSDPQAVLDVIDKLATQHKTGGHAGLAFGYFTLSPNWRRIFGNATATDYTDNSVRKVALVLSDGAFNWPSQPVPSNGYDGRTMKEMEHYLSNEYGRQTCKEMRDRGIEVYAVGFDLESLESEGPGVMKMARQQLKDCSSLDGTGDKLYFETATGDGLVAIFDYIARQYTEFRLAS